MSEERSLEGWTPEPDGELSLARIIDLAFDYRGNTTVVMRDGGEVHGYVFNRSADTGEPFLQMFDTEGNGPFTIRYADIRTVRFSGKDTAAGSSYAAWLSRRKQQRAGNTTAGSLQDDDASPQC